MAQNAWKLPAVIAGAILLSACGGKASTNEQSDANAAAGNAAAASAANSAVPATPAAAPAAGGLTAEFMVGKWSAFNGDCSKTIELRKDGTADTPIGTAKWTVNGGTLSFDYQDGSKPTVSAVKPVGANEIEFTHDSGTKEIEKRWG